MPRRGGGQRGPLVGADASAIRVAVMPGSPMSGGGGSSIGVAPAMGGPGGGGGRHKVTKANLDALAVPDVVRYIVVVTEAAGAKLEDEAVGPASVLFKRHKGGRGHLQREEKARAGDGREGRGAHREGGGALKVELAFRRNPKTARGGGRQREGGQRGRASTTASNVAGGAGFRVEGERGEVITTHRTRGRMLQRFVVLREGGLVLRVI